MPEIGAQNLDVSAEEERYLRRVFRRQALPYLILVAALAALGGWVASGSSGGPSAEALEELRGELDELRASVEALSVRAEAVANRVHAGTERISALEARQTAVGGGELVALESELRSARNRMFDLEKRLERRVAPEGIGALTERVSRLELQLERRATVAAPVAPAAPATPPLPPSEPADSRP